jgi:hypothetical protein
MIMAELRYLTIPKNVDVVVHLGTTRGAWSFVDSVAHVVDSHPIFNQSGQGIRAGIRILDKLKGRKEGEVVTLDEVDWKLLHEAFETSAAGFIPPLTAPGADGVFRPMPLGARTFLPYIDAVSDEATKKVPDTHAVTNGVALPLPEAAKA